VRIIFLSTATESVSEIMVVFVVRGGLLGVNAFTTGLRVFAQCAGRCSRHASRTAIANEAALIEKFDESMFAVAGDRARITDRGGSIRVIGVVGNGVTGQTSEEALAQWSEVMGT
jgi:hypothetical protein